MNDWAPILHAIKMTVHFFMCRPFYGKWHDKTINIVSRENGKLLYKTTKRYRYCQVCDYEQEAT